MEVSYVVGAREPDAAGGTHAGGIAVCITCHHEAYDIMFVLWTSSHTANVQIWLFCPHHRCCHRRVYYNCQGA